MKTSIAEWYQIRYSYDIMKDYMSVAQAAEKLDVSPRRVRAIIANGDLAAEKVGRGWLVSRGSIQVELSRNRPQGRKWSQMAAWALLARAANAERPSRCSNSEWSRAGQRLRENGVLASLPRLSSRAEVRSYFAHPSVLPSLIADQQLLRSGVSAASNLNADIIAIDEIEGYVLASDLEEVVRSYSLMERNVDDGNVKLHVADADEWPIPASNQMAHRLLVALDLCESNDERSQLAGHKLLEEVLR